MEVDRMHCSKCRTLCYPIEKDGQRLWHCPDCPTNFPRIVGVLSTYKDINEIKDRLEEAEERLLRLEERVSP